MAVYTPVSEDEMRAFTGAYDLGPLIAFEGVRAGVSNTTYRLETGRGTFVLTLFEPWRVAPEEVPFFMDYARTLHAAGIPCPEVLHNDRGQIVTPLCGRPAAVVSFLDGMGGDAAALTPDLCREGGILAARMHKAAMAIGQEKPNPFGPSRWKTWLETMSADIDSIAPGLFDRASSEYAFLIANWPSTLPRGAIHGDFFPDNVFFKDEKVSGVIDFHFVCTDFFAYEVAIAVNAWCFDSENRFDPARFDAFMDGYQSIRSLNEDEKAALPVLFRAAALRFLLSRCEEALSVKDSDHVVPHDPLVFLSRLRHFQGGGMIDIFTDGACSGNPGPGGWGAILRWNGHEKELSGGEDVTTNNRMEMMAVIRALQSLKKPSPVTIHTDSQYVQKGVAEGVEGKGVENRR